MTKRESGERNQAGFGITGLDDILAGGLERDRLYLLEGSPGTGKTTAALSFLLAGREAGEKTLYVTLSETEIELLCDDVRATWASLQATEGIVWIREPFATESGHVAVMEVPDGNVFVLVGG